MEQPAQTTVTSVIIVGAGIAGLVLANILKLFGVEFVLLEADSHIERPTGGSFGLWPNAARILDQLGCWSDVKIAGSPIEKSYMRSPDGKVLMSSEISKAMLETFGYEAMVLERRDLIGILHRHLGSESNIRSKTSVLDVVYQPDAVCVLTADGSRFRGHIVVGCDGVHSKVRQIMWEHANLNTPRVIDVTEKKFLTSAYYCLVGVAPQIPGLSLNELNVTQGERLSLTIVTQPGKTMFLACIKESDSSRWPRKVRFSAEDANQEASRIADVPVTEHVLFGEIWRKRQRGYLCSIQEGLLHHWYFGRIVLVGDSVHTLSPVGAQSGNCAIESAAALANALKDHLLPHFPEDVTPKTISLAFESYQQKRLQRVKRFFDSTYMLTRLNTWDTRWYWLLARYVLPWKDSASFVQELMVNAEKIESIHEPRDAKGFGPTAVTGMPVGDNFHIRRLTNILRTGHHWLLTK